MNELTPHQKDTIGRAAHLRQDILRFTAGWPALNSSHDLAPQFTWSELERQLASLSASPAASAMVSDLVSATRKQAPFKPTEMVLREILCIASAVMDETFPPADHSEDSSSPDSEVSPMR